MTKIIFKTIMLLTLFQSCKGQSDNKAFPKSNFIDSIQNAKQIAALIAKIDDRYKEFQVNENLKFSEKDCQRTCDSLKVQPWAKVDFDNNGLTDILVVGNWYYHSVLCILDKGNNYEIKPITRKIFQECTFPLIQDKSIKYYFESYQEWNEPHRLKQITLVYKFGDFIEENKTTDTHKIEKIEYSTTGCYGTCPIYNLTINSDRSAKWFAEMYNKIKNKEVKGNFQATITQNKYDEIINLLDYIDFEKLEDNYAVSWTDDQSSTLKIVYDNGKTKSINDYGLIGTYGLGLVYELLFALRENQEWTK